MRTLPFLILASALCGCSISVDKSLYVDADGSDLRSASGASGSPDGSLAARDGSQSAAQHGGIDIDAVWESTTEADSELHQTIRGAIEAVLTGQGTASGGEADAGGDDGAE